MDKKVSIIIPIYNGIEYFENSLISVYNQNYCNYEVIVAINGHPINSDVYKRAVEEVKVLSRIKNIKLPITTVVVDMGILKGRKSEALNRALEYCSGDYICMLDVDDVWIYNKLKFQVDLIGNYDVIGTKCEYFGNATGCPYIPIGDISNFDFTRLNPIINSSFMVKKSIFENGIKWNEDNLYGLEDYEFWLDCRYIYQFKIYNIDEILVLHRIHNNSAFNNNNSDYLTEFKKKYYIKFNNRTSNI